jgi:GST-like protein
MYTLFGTQGSGSAAIEVALEAVGAPYRVVRASSWEPDSALAELQQVNPLVQIPTLQCPDGSVLTESAAILIHLGLAFPAAALLPADLVQRSQAIRGLVFIAANCYSAVSIADYPERWVADIDDAARARLIRGARAQLHRHWEIFAEQFPATPFFCGGSGPGALDFLAAVVSKWSGTRAHLKANRPDFLATLKMIEAHPVVAPVFARHWPAE